MVYYNWHPTLDLSKSRKTSQIHLSRIVGPYLDAGLVIKPVSPNHTEIYWVNLWKSFSSPVTYLIMCILIKKNILSYGNMILKYLNLLKLLLQQ